MSFLSELQQQVADKDPSATAEDLLTAIVEEEDAYTHLLTLTSTDLITINSFLKENGVDTEYIDSKASSKAQAYATLKGLKRAKLV